MVECPLESWFAGQGWSPHDFQRDAWNAYGKAEEVLIQAPTGSGKTYAGLGAAIREGVRRADAGDQAKGLQLIWIAPIRALTKEIQYSAQRMDGHGIGLGGQCSDRRYVEQGGEPAQKNAAHPHHCRNPFMMLAMKGVEKRLAP